MIDILFLNLHRRYLNSNNNYGGFLGIYILAAFVRQFGYNAKSFAGNLHEGVNILDQIAKNVAMFGLYCDYENVTENLFLCQYIKSNYNRPVIVGGPQATALDANFAANCDAIVRYEGELTVLDLMNFFLEGVGELENIAGISYLRDNVLVTNPERPLIQNLDALPFIDADCYLEPKTFFSGLSLMTGRGCPFRCTFCHEGAHTRQVRFRSVQNVLAEIDAFLEVWRGDELYILFTDDTFTLNAERVEKICNALIQRRKSYNLKFFCEGHVHTLYNNPAMIQHLAAAGCARIQLGIESGTPEVLKAYGKNTSPAEILEVVKLCRDAGINQIYGNIILGGAFFTPEVFNTERNFARQLLTVGQGALELGVVTLWTLPQTKITRCPDEFNINVLDEDFLTAVGGDFPQVDTPTLDKFDIAQMELQLQNEILAHMHEMLESWQVPISRVLSWFPTSNNSYHSLWFLQLQKCEILAAYFEILHKNEGFHSSQIENLADAHPMRVAVLYKYLRRIDNSTVQICGEFFHGVEVDIILLTTGKLSVNDISLRLNLDFPTVAQVLHKLEFKHFIVYTKF